MIADLLGFLFVLPFIVAIWFVVFYAIKWLQRNWTKIGDDT